ncbi:hypothetical protein [Dyadobacter sp. Leaf189]|uniref:hypothetical protein n=1 Tax=Dyadobacter sp. Leaf189 TaxID=1736295 RepID=UPI000ADBDBEC|nr:hypothetical protein [Dyadobacter sp. Leaf189]
MKDEIIPIKKENAQRAFEAADETGKALLVGLLGEETFNIDIKDRVKSYEDACRLLQIKPAQLSEFTVVPREFRAPTYAFHRLCVIAKALNEGWEPDWDNNNQYKYYPWFDMRSKSAGGSGFSFYDSYCVSSFATVGSRLVFRTDELARYAGTQFLEIYREWMVIE